MDKGYICYKNLKLEYGNKYNFKSLLLPKLGLNEKTFKIETLDHISELQIKFSKTFPFNNNDVINGICSFDLDYIVEQMIVLGNGGICIIQNILFGMLLQEFGLEIQFIQCYDFQLPAVSFYKHASNILKFNCKLYLVEACYASLACLYPIEIDSGNYNGLEFKKTIHRVIKINSCSPKEGEDEKIYLQQCKIGSKDWNSLLSFSLDHVTYEHIKNSINQVINHAGINNRNKFKMFMLYLNVDNGHYLYHDGKFQIYIEGQPKKSIVVNNSTQLSKIIIHYFKINNFDLKFLKNWDIDPAMSKL